MPRARTTAFYLVYVTVGTLEQARQLGRQVVEARLAACVNIIPGMQSIYHWQGRLCEENECVLVAKTTAARRAALMARLRELHSYECPCIVALPIVAGHQPFLDWLATETAAAAKP